MKYCIQAAMSLAPRGHNAQQFAVCVKQSGEAAHIKKAEKIDE
jgi:hypothetical protein